MTYNKGDKMTSKEGLKLLETRCRFFAQDEDELQETYEARETIKKDLEILEILKKSMSVDTEVFENDNHEVVEYEYIAFNDWDLDIENKEEYNKIKNWLKEK